MSTAIAAKTANAAGASLLIVWIFIAVSQLRLHRQLEHEAEQPARVGVVEHDHDQFLRLESGQGRIMIGEDKNNLDIDQVVEDDFAQFRLDVRHSVAHKVLFYVWVSGAPHGHDRE